MLKITLYAVLMLAPVFCFAENFCEICGRNISLAKNSRRCAVCTIREPVGKMFAVIRGSKNGNMEQAMADRQVRQLGEYAIWNFICVEQMFPVKVVDSSGEHPLDYRTVLPVRENPARIRIVLKDGADTFIIHTNGKIEKRCGIYVLDNVPICLPNKNLMTLYVQRCVAKGAIECALVAEGRGDRRVSKIGTVYAGGRLDFSDFY